MVGQSHGAHHFKTVIIRSSIINLCFLILIEVELIEIIRKRERKRQMPSTSAEGNVSKLPGPLVFRHLVVNGEGRLRLIPKLLETVQIEPLDYLVNANDLGPR